LFVVRLTTIELRTPRTRKLSATVAFALMIGLQTSENATGDALSFTQKIRRKLEIGSLENSIDEECDRLDDCVEITLL
jgi:hypothetical protein